MPCIFEDIMYEMMLAMFGLAVPLLQSEADYGPDETEGHETGIH